MPSITTIKILGTALAVGALIFYMSSLKLNLVRTTHELETSIASSELLKLELEKQIQLVTESEGEWKAMLQANSRLDSKNSKLNKDNQLLTKRNQGFQGRLDEIAKQKPGLIELRANRELDRFMRQFVQGQNPDSSASEHSPNNSATPSNTNPTQDQN